MLKYIISHITLPLLITTATAADTPQVVVSIKPIHALVSGVMADVGTPALLLQGGESPHTYTMKPSQVKMLHDADLVVWIGAGIETFLEKPLTTLNKQTQQLRLLDITGLTLLKVRQGGVWESHPHHDSNSHEEEHEEDTQFDPHLWLSPLNAKVMAKAIADTLSQNDPHHATQYAKNLSRLLHQLDQLDQELKVQLAPLQQIPFLVFHDAYQYFEMRYGLTAVGAVTLSPEQSPSVKRLSELRTRLKELQVRCVFSEPQFEPALVNTLIEDTTTRLGTLDPVGAELQAGEEAYVMLLRNLAKSFQECLMKNG